MSKNNSLESVFFVEGSLSHNNIVKVRNSGVKEIKHSNGRLIIFDFSKSIIIDNSAISLLTSWIRYSRSEGVDIKFINLPSKLKDMSRLTGLDSILEIIRD